MREAVMQACPEPEDDIKDTALFGLLDYIETAEGNM